MNFEKNKIYFCKLKDIKDLYTTNKLFNFNNKILIYKNIIYEENYYFEFYSLTDNKNINLDPLTITWYKFEEL